MPPGLHRALYIAAWMDANDRPSADWWRNRTATRRWAPGTGFEWRTLGATSGYIAAIHVLRLLTGSLPGGAR